MMNTTYNDPVENEAEEERLEALFNRAIEVFPHELRDMVVQYGDFNPCQGRVHFRSEYEFECGTLGSNSIKADGSLDMMMISGGDPEIRGYFCATVNGVDLLGDLKELVWRYNIVSETWSEPTIEAV